MSELDDVLRDLTAEGDELDRLVSSLDPEQWRLPTPAPGWTIHDQIAHLSFIFRLAGAAASDPEKFKALATGAEEDFEGAVNAALGSYADDSPEVLLGRWRAERAAVVQALAAVPAGQVVPWLVNPLPPIILACAGIMEQFAHGQDIADAVGAELERTDRLAHLVVFAVLTRDFGYLARDLTPPATEFRFELTSPSGELWAFGPEDSEQRISGPAVDFCLLATRRRHRDDLALTATGDEADHWMDIAQCYRGPAGAGRAPGQFAPVAV
ncbi:TIGR03084 family metal-binding protein [Sphaerisporangium sp. TRM90804]|uniref:TIGR03084 family metal-binding protein n=1 Tax=Sphaerisporangium sp. TRM90804 TaxID=3031113 RepID=UPI0024470E5B|nr:TIGR03084 family metal-binding protein [Sphaerisporangium sp. TRM90804]MDH2428410.1 TIGR03084 family metal-binding protein [Sphaerisporangium sp. TRM90804]